MYAFVWLKDWSEGFCLISKICKKVIWLILIVFKRFRHFLFICRAELEWRQGIHFIDRVSLCKPHCIQSVKECCSSGEILHYFLNELHFCSAVEFRNKQICKKCKWIYCLTLSDAVIWAAVFSAWIRQQVS